MICNFSRFTSMINFSVLSRIRSALRRKCPYSELFWSLLSRICTEYEEIIRRCGVDLRGIWGLFLLISWRQEISMILIDILMQDKQMDIQNKVKDLTDGDFYKNFFQNISVLYVWLDSEYASDKLVSSKLF